MRMMTIKFVPRRLSQQLNHLLLSGPRSKKEPQGGRGGGEKVEEACESKVLGP